MGDLSTDAEGEEGVSSPLGPQRKRRKRADLEQIVLRGGRMLLKQEGLGTGLEHMTFKKVFSYIEQISGVKVANSSVIGRIWANQEEFQEALLLSVLDEDVDGELESSLTPVLILLEGANRSNLASRVAVLTELCRVGGAANLEWVVGAGTWPTWVGAWATAVTGNPEDARRRLLAERMRENYERYTETFEDVYAMAFEYLGFRLREPLTVRQFTIAVGALAEGCGLRDMVDRSSVRGIVLPTGPDGEGQEWSLFSIGLEAILQRFVEPIPRWRPSRRQGGQTGA